MPWELCGVSVILSLHPLGWLVGEIRIILWLGSLPFGPGRPSVGVVVDLGLSSGPRGGDLGLLLWHQEEIIWEQGLEDTDLVVGELDLVLFLVFGNDIVLLRF